MIESLRTKLLAERRRNLVQEMEIRKEMGDAMLQQLMESEELRRYLPCIYVLQDDIVTPSIFIFVICLACWY